MSVPGASLSSVRRRIAVTDEKGMLRRIYWWSFVARFSAGMAGLLLMQFARVAFLEDALNYERIGAGIAQDWLSGRTSSWLANDGQNPNTPLLIILTIACFYTLTLGVRALPLLIGFYCAITAFAPVLTYRIARQIGAARSAAAAGAWIVVFSPAFAFWCGALYKEGLILVLLHLAIYHTLRLRAGWTPHSLFMLGASLLGLAFLRLYIATIAGVMLCPGLLLARSYRRALPGQIPSLATRIAITVLLTMTMAGIGFLAQIHKSIPTDPECMLGRIAIARYDLAVSADSGYLRDASISTPQDALQFLPLGLGYFLTVPHPWQIGSLRQNLAIPDTTIWVGIIYPLALLGAVSTMRRNFPAAILILAITFAICGWYALIIANIGTAYRLRVQVWALWAIFAGIGWELLRGRPAFQPSLRPALRWTSEAPREVAVGSLTGSQCISSRPASHQTQRGRFLGPAF